MPDRPTCGGALVLVQSVALLAAVALLAVRLAGGLQGGRSGGIERGGLRQAGARSAGKSMQCSTSASRSASCCMCAAGG